MLLSLFLPIALALQTQTPEPTQPAQPAPTTTTAPPATQPATGPMLKPLSFHSQRFDYKWDTLLPVHVDVDGLKVNTIFFNRRQMRTWPLKNVNFGVRAQVEVTNTSQLARVPHFAVAVFDNENRLLGVAGGGTRIGSVKPGGTETFDLNFTWLNERLPLGTYYYLAVELTE
jgi:hypothetical protein